MIYIITAFLTAFMMFSVYAQQPGPQSMQRNNLKLCAAISQSAGWKNGDQINLGDVQDLLKKMDNKPIIELTPPDAINAVMNLNSSDTSTLTFNCQLVNLPPKLAAIYFSYQSNGTTVTLAPIFIQTKQ